MSGPELFLGREALPGQDGAGADWRLPAARLRTHGVVVGMTGSGKTGLCLVLLEELVRAGVPIIAIDPKGDLGNLALLFPALDGPSFAPWVEGGVDPAATAASWRAGLAEVGLGAEQLASLQRGMALTVYTPGSSAGTPVDLLGAFRRPRDLEGLEPDALDPETLRGLVATTVSGLLALVGRQGQPVRDPAHVVLSLMLETAWLAGEDPDLETLILRLLDPPMDKVGVFPLDRFFPPADRAELAMALNAVVAAPSFKAWSQGQALDIQALLGGAEGPARPGGRTPVHVFHLAQLDDAGRSLFVTLLLGRLQAWSRGLPGTEALRAVLFFDEVAGYMPPHPHDPPTKAPLLAMMKQARAVGLGVVLATQNPVDVDYKALSNAGLWFLGRLQTPQDRRRVLEGLGRPELDARVAALERRRFLVVDASQEAPAERVIRHAMCFLRGPLTRVELGRLRQGPALPLPPSPPPPSPVLAQSDASLAAPPPAPGESWFLDPAVAFAHRLGGIFAKAAGPPRADGQLLYRPVLLAEIWLRFDESNGFLLEQVESRVWSPLEAQGGLPEPRAIALEPGDLRLEPPAGARFLPLPPWLDEARELAALQKDIVARVLQSESRGQRLHPGLKLYARADEDAAAFDQRVGAAIQARIDARMAKLRERFEREGQRIEARIADRQARLVEQKGVLRARQAEEVVNVGETLWSFFGGRKKSVSTAMSKRRQTTQAADRADRTEQELADLQQEAYELERKLEAELLAITTEEEAARSGVVEQPVRLEKDDLRLQRFGILWVPASRRL